jgi:DNA-binding IclR family transcriptional regulator
MLVCHLSPVNLADHQRAMKAPAARRQGIQSVEMTGPLLVALAAVEAPLMLKDLALAAGMPAAKAHRYLVSLARLGLVAQDENGRYDLGPFALQIGLAALNRLDAVKPATRAIENLRDALGETIGLVTWGTHGATFIRIAEPIRPVTVSLRAGAIAPLTSSATGFVFAAYLHPAVADPVLKRELEGRAPMHPHSPSTPAVKSRRALETVVRRVREEGVAYATSAFAPGVNSYAAPVFDHLGRLAFAIAVIGYAEYLGTGPDTAVARALLAATRALSAHLGYRPA